MKDFLIEEFEEYKVYLYDALVHGEDYDEAITIRYSQGEVHFVFYHQGVHTNRVEDKANGNSTYFVYIPTAKYDRYIDLLRHEKPLYIAIDHDKVQVYITTEMEPVGEGDQDQS